MRSDRQKVGIDHWARRSVARAAVVAITALATACGSSSSSGPDESSDGSLLDTGAQDDVVSTQDGSGNSGGQDATLPADGGVTDAATVADGASADGEGAETGTELSDASIADAGASDADAGPPVPTLFAPAGVSLYGITSDDYVVYFNGSDRTFYAQATESATATPIYTLPDTLYTSAPTFVGKDVFIYTFADPDVREGPLLVWSSSLAAAAPLGNTGLDYLYQTAWASEDSQHVVYVQVSAGNGYISDLYGANADGTGITPIATNINTYPGAIACFPRVVMRGGYAVVSYCSAADAGSVPILQSFAIGNGWAPATVTTNWIASNNYQAYIENLDPNAFSFAVDPDAGKVVAASSTSGDAGLQAFPIGGGAGSVLDPTWALTPSLSFAGSKTNPWSVLYNTDAGALEQTLVSSPAPHVLADAGVGHFDAYSTDGKWMLTSSQMDPEYGFGDMSVVSTVAPGSPQLLASEGQFGGLPIATCDLRPGCAFTTDLSRAIVYTNNVENNEDSWIFYAHSMPIGGGTPTLISTGYATDTFPLKGAKVLVLDNFQDSDGGAGPTTVDLHVVDSAVGAPGTLVASSLTFNYGEVPQTSVVTSDLSTIFYTVSQGAAPGVYKYVVP